MTLYYHAKLMYYKWAIKDMDVQHPDLLHVMLTINDLEEKLK